MVERHLGKLFRMMKTPFAASLKENEKWGCGRGPGMKVINFKNVFKNKLTFKTGKLRKV